MKSAKGFQCQRTGKIFPTEALVRKSENAFPKTKIAELKRRIAKGKYWLPKKGDVIYVRSSMSIDHGWDDVAGGLALVVDISYGVSGGVSETPFIEVAQHYGDIVRLMRKWRGISFKEIRRNSQNAKLSGRIHVDRTT